MREVAATALNGAADTATGVARDAAAQCLRISASRVYKALLDVLLQRAHALAVLLTLMQPSLGTVGI